MKLYRANVISVLTYGCETWQLKLKEEQQIESFHYQCLRKILKIDWRKHVSNIEISKVANIPSALQVIKRQRLKWFGHIQRMPRNRLPKKLLEWEPSNGATKPGKPKTTWKDTIKRDLMDMKITYEEAEAMARDRKQWLSMIDALCTNR